MCERQRIRSKCEECGEEHQRRRHLCKECSGSGICDHQRRSKGKECRVDAAESMPPGLEGL